jgi:hypothetical protein
MQIRIIIFLNLGAVYIYTVGHKTPLSSYN